jgi:hypothetical protein
MNNNWIIGSLLVALIIVASAGFVLDQMNVQNQTNNTSTDMIGQQSSQTLSQSAAIKGSISHSMSLSVLAKGSPKTILVYKTVPPNASRSRLEEYARNFHVNGTYGEGTGGMSIQSDELVNSVTIEKASGTIVYAVVGRPDDILDSPDNLPSDEESVRIATQFLKENNLYPDGAYFRKTDRHYERSTDKTGNEILHAGQIEVWFGRKLNNLDVEGTQLSVDVGGKGDIIGYYANWREYAPAGEYPIKSRETAFEDMKKIGIKTEMNNPSISMTDATLAYRTKAGAYEEEYLEPIWEFSGTVSSDKEGSQSVSKFIPALSEESVKSLSSS